jgi:lipid-A-disaccharide synthase
MVVAYRLARTTYRLIKTLRLVRSEVYALPNILAGRMLVPERMQDACTAEALAEDLLPYLVNRSAPPELLAEFHRQHARLRAPPDSDAAAAVLELFRQRRPALHQ